MLLVCVLAVLFLSVAVATNSASFCFEFSKRHSFPRMFEWVLRLLMSVCASVNGGTVVFFPSFAMLEGFLAAAAAPLIAALRKEGPILAELQSPGRSKTDGSESAVFCCPPFIIPKLLDAFVY